MCLVTITYLDPSDIVQADSSASIRSVTIATALLLHLHVMSGATNPILYIYDFVHGYSVVLFAVLCCVGAYVEIGGNDVSSSVTE